MVEEQLKPRGISDERVLDVMMRLPRHWFVDEALAPQAYNDSPLNIGHGQTISQPVTVALLAQALHLTGNEEVLEIGTGCGYQTAVLASLSRKIYSIERLSPLLMKARVNLKRLGITNVILKYGDGSKGWPERGPFQAIVAAAVSPQVPEPLLRQLAEGGRLVLPVEKNGKQHLVLVIRRGDRFEQSILKECRFVKMVGHYAYGA
ncbi:MAG: protein-L-isoaspartate(D-aspartate) O-methyltransferase [bacterium]